MKNSPRNRVSCVNLCHQGKNIIETRFLLCRSQLTPKPEAAQKPGFLRQPLPPTPETGFLKLTFATNEQIS
ncbi:hypothetical protein [Planktothricoides raciborskii]|uniref:Uncharacterized protein n=1 Tax=Planktothricoides raciborskii GIHE-MW2 TaxID=2792601 RepID=A0AAU8JIT7_9CYAN